MDSPATRLDFAAIGHQECWNTITRFVNGMRAKEQGRLSLEQVRDVYPFIPPRDVFKVKVKSSLGREINGSYIETFIDPEKLAPAFARTNLLKVQKAANRAVKMNSNVVALGGFTSILLEGNGFNGCLQNTSFTTGNSLTAAFIVKGVERACSQLGISLRRSNLLVVGATGDLGLACVNYFAHKVRQMLLCARNLPRVKKLAALLDEGQVAYKYSDNLVEIATEADIIISVASSSGLELHGLKPGVLICDAGYPKNLHAAVGDHDCHLFYGGMGQATGGLSFSPDYSPLMYNYPAPAVIHGCLLEAMVLAFENNASNFSWGKGNITSENMELIYERGLSHGVRLAPFFNAKGLW